MRLSIVAVGSRGDVQPYLALGLGLERAGFQVQICADRLFETLITSTGLAYTPITAAPVGMLQQNLSKYGGPLRLMSWLNRHFRPMAHQFFADVAEVTTQADAILYSTLAFAGYHVAQKHAIPALGVYNVPITPTHAFQNPSFPPPPAWFPFKSAYNWWSFRMANQLFIYLIKPIVNECRTDVLGLQPLPGSFYRRLDVSTIPLVYGFRPNLLPQPDDWGEWIKLSGHWFLEDRTGWEPPHDLLRFLDGGDAPVYIGFGSMVDDQIKHITPIVLGALHRLGKRAILMGGWGGLGLGDLPATIFRLESAPHSWLFPRLSAVVHHGGSGTTATGLRYGKPTLVIPFFADQPFWGSRVLALGCGPVPIPFARLSLVRLTAAIDRLLTDPAYLHNAQLMSQRLEVEDGIGKAVGFIQNYLSHPPKFSMDKY